MDYFKIDKYLTMLINKIKPGATSNRIKILLPGGGIMSLLSKFVDSLHVNIVRAGNREGMKPFSMINHFQKSNVIVQLQKGNIFVGKDGLPMERDSFYFQPAAQPIYTRYGLPPYREFGENGFDNENELGTYLRLIEPHEERNDLEQVYSFLVFELSLFNAIPFFEVLELPAFAIPPDEEFGFLIKHIAGEFYQNKLGREKLINGYMEQVVIHLCRFLESQVQFKKHIDKLEFLSDRRLVDIVKYIQMNLGSDLSNKTIANVAFVSEDYVGQFFKTLTKKNLQD